MPRRCVTCSHEEIAEINRRLREAGREPLNLIAARFGLSPDAMERHVARHLDRMAAPTRKAARVASQRVAEREEALPAPGSAHEDKVAAAPSHDNRPDSLSCSAAASEASEAALPSSEPASTDVKQAIPAKALSPQQAKTRFLEVLAEYGSMSRAAKAAGVSRSKVHRWLEDDEVFGFAYHQSLVAATEGLEEVARERATRGARIERQIWRAGRLIETVIEYRPSDSALITLLKAQKPDVYRERVDQNVSGEVSVRYTNDWRSAPSGPSSSGSA